MVEEIRGPVISFPDSALREGKMSGVLQVLLNYLQERGGGGEKEGERNKNKASYFSIINFR